MRLTWSTARRAGPRPKPAGAPSGCGQCGRRGSAAAACSGRTVGFVAMGRRGHCPHRRWPAAVAQLPPPFGPARWTTHRLRRHSQISRQPLSTLQGSSVCQQPAASSQQPEPVFPQEARPGGCRACPRCNLVRSRGNRQSCAPGCVCPSEICRPVTTQPVATPRCASWPSSSQAAPSTGRSTCLAGATGRAFSRRCSGGMYSACAAPGPRVSACSLLGGGDGGAGGAGGGGAGGVSLPRRP